jgi:ABC-type transporter Mla MlaB component
MAMIAVFLNIDAERIVPALREAGGNLDSAQGETVLDLSSVRRIDSGGLRALEEFARVADVDVYKVLKLVRLTQRFSFMN